jgi:hypothetical protein
MRKMIFLLLALPLAGLAQNKNLVSTARYFTKPGMWQKFETAISAHAKKYHNDDFAWRVYTIETGPDAGGYMVVEGPNNWGSVDGRGDLGAAHMADWENTVQVNLTDRTSNVYYEYREGWSTSPISEMADKISISHVFLNPGYRGEYVEDVLKPNKKLWEVDGARMAVYDASLSGQPQIAIVTRYTKGLKVRDESNPVGFVERFKKANGGGDYVWNRWIEMSKLAVRNQWTELLTLKPNLGSN